MDALSGSARHRRVAFLWALALIVLLAISGSVASANTAYASTAVDSAPNADGVRILCTTDTHSQDAPGKFKNADGTTNNLGGFARLATALQDNRLTDKTLVFDSGDFSEGTIFATLLTTDAVELSQMSRLGYNAIALGNHDFDYGDQALVKELSSYRSLGGTTPVLCSNLVNSADTSHTATDNSANPLAASGVSNYQIIQTNGHKVGVFSLMGKEAADYTSTEEYAFADTIKTAQDYVKFLRDQEGCDLVVLLSHCGTVTGEDQKLAEKVSGIDVIVSGHAHVILDDPLQINGCIIVSPGVSLNALGVLDLNYKDGTWSLGNYKNVMLNESVPEDSATTALIKTDEDKIQSDYLAYYEIPTALNESMAYSNQTTEDLAYLDENFGNNLIGQTVADSYSYALQQAGVDDVDVCLTPTGSIRSAIFEGDVTTGDIFNVLSLYQSKGDGRAGSPLVTASVSGHDIYDLCEVSRSISKMMTGVQLAFSGLEFTYDSDRLFMNQVTSVRICDKTTGAWIDVSRNDDTLYKLSTTQDVASMLGMVSDQSFGMLNVTLRDESGETLDPSNLTARVVHYQTASGQMRELKEWIALYQYASSHDVGASGLPELYSGSTQPEERFSNVNQGFFAAHFTNLNKFAYVVYAAVVVLVAAVVGLVFLVRHLVRKHRRRVSVGRVV